MSFDLTYSINEILSDKSHILGDQYNFRDDTKRWSIRS